MRPQGQPPGRRGEHTLDRPPPDRRRADRTTSVQPAPHPGDIWLYGRHTVAAALANPQRRIRRLVALPETAEEGKRLAAAATARLLAAAALEILPREAFEALLPAGAVHQGLALAAVPLPALALEDIIAKDVIAEDVTAPAATAPGAGQRPQIVVLLDQVSDPHNVGAVLRSAAAFGALAVIVPERGAPPVTGVLAKAASGALEHVPMVRVVNLARAIDQLKGAGFWCVGLDEAAADALPALGLGGRIALVLGAEGEGMRRLTRERCDLVARLPTSGTLAALNVSNAAAIALYELNRSAALAMAEGDRRRP